MRVALVNTNRMRPPIGPIGLDYVAEALHAGGHQPEVLDLCWEESWRDAIRAFFCGKTVGLVGVSLRNTDDCAFTAGQSFMPETAEMVREIRKHSDATVVMGGVGFSVMPREVLEHCGAEAGAWGEGEGAFPKLADRVEAGEGWVDVPGLVVG